MRLDAETFNQLELAVVNLQAEEALLAVKISDFPYMTKDARSDFYKELIRKSKPSIFEEEKKAISLEELGRLIQNG